MRKGEHISSAAFMSPKRDRQSCNDATASFGMPDGPFLNHQPRPGPLRSKYSTPDLNSIKVVKYRASRPPMCCGEERRYVRFRHVLQRDRSPP